MKKTGGRKSRDTLSLSSLICQTLVHAGIYKDSLTRFLKAVHVLKEKRIYPLHVLFTLSYSIKLKVSSGLSFLLLQLANAECHSVNFSTPQIRFKTAAVIGRTVE